MIQAAEDVENHHDQLEPVIFLVWEDLKLCPFLNRVPVKTKQTPPASVRMIPSDDDGSAK